MTIKGYAVFEKSGKLKEYEYEPESLGEWDIDVEISHCGICHSDIHLIDNDWGFSSYPFVPGHEIIGRLKNKGKNIQHINIGDRIGVGWQRSSCMHCEWCDQGEENLCLEQEATCINHNGGFANQIRCDGRFAFLIPEGLPSEQAAPLLCGGATVFSPFIEHNITATSKVGVIGVGGLGHLAVQFAKSFGCEVTAFSHSPDKEREAKELGAHHFISSTDHDGLQKITNSLDFLLCTISVPLDWEEYTAVLRPKGVLCFVGVQSEPLKLPILSLLPGRKCVCASNIASRPDMNDMLNFAALHGIHAQIEEFPLAEVNQAIDRVRSGKVRYRAVLNCQ